MPNSAMLCIVVESAKKKGRQTEINEWYEDFSKRQLHSLSRGFAKTAILLMLEGEDPSRYKTAIEGLVEKIKALQVKEDIAWLKRHGLTP